MFFFALFSAGFVYASYLVLYRFGYEIPDPRWPPVVETRPANGPWIPGRRVIDASVLEAPEPEVRTVPRPYAVNTTANVTDDLDPARVDIGKTVMAPSGREVAVKDLVDFVKFAPIYGATFRPWKERGWAHNRWKDVVRVWQIYGVVSANGERTTTEIIVTDLKEALTKLSSAFA